MAGLLNAAEKLFAAAARQFSGKAATGSNNHGKGEFVLSHK
jgi:hypothetical protein